MRLNQNIASAFLTGLFVSTCLLTPASAQEKSLAPQGAWALTKVDRTAQGGKSYCTLSRKYDDNVVVSLGRNQTEEYSLAIDFQKPVFDRDKSVKINLQPGPGQIRAYDMIPTSEKAVVIRLGWDTGFFDALNASQNMKVKIGEQSYAFAMPEVAKGQTELKDCMEGLKTASAGTSAPAATTDVLAAAPSTASSDFSAGKVEEKIAAAQAAKADIAAQEAKILDNFAADMKAQEPALRSADKLFLADQRQENPAINEEKRTQVAKAEPAPVPPQKPKTELVKRPPVSDETTKVAAITPAAGESEADRKAQQAKIDAAAKAAAAAEAQKTAAANKAAEAARAQAAAEAEKTVAASKMAEAAKAAAAAEMEKAVAAAKAAEAAKMAAAKSEAELTSLQTRLKDMSGENDALKQKTAEELEKSSTKVNTLQKRLADIAAENEALKQKSAIVSPETKKQMAAIELEKQSLEERLVAAEKEKAKLSVQQVTIADRAKELEEKNARLEQELKLSQTKMAEATTLASSQKNEQLKSLQTRLAMIAAENQKLKEQSDAISPKAQKQIDTMETENAKLQESLSELRGKVDQSAKTKKQIEEAEAEKKKLEEKLAKAKAEVQKQPEVQKQMDALQAENKALQEKLASAEADAAKKAIEINAQGEAAKQNASMTTMPVDEDKVAQLEAQKKELEAKLAAAEQKAKDQPAAAASPDASKAQEKISELEIRNKQLEESLRASQVRIGEAALNTETKALRQIADLEGKLEAAQKDNTNIAKQLESYRTQQEDGRLSLVGGDWNLEQATKRFNEAEREIKRLGQESEKQRMACNAEKSKIEQMLFDPAVTESKQIEKLESLEAQLKEANAKLAQGGIKTADASEASVEVQSIEPAAGAPENTGSMSWSSETPKSNLGTGASAGSKKMEQENARLRAETARLQQQVTDLEQGVASASGTAQAASEKMEVDRLKRQLARAQTQSATYQDQLARAQATPEATAQDQHLLAQSLNELQPTAGAAMAAPKPPAVKPKVAEIASYSPANLKTLLQKAGVSANGLKKASGGMSGAENFTWSQGAGMTGSASVKKSGAFEGQVQQYLDQQKSACNGDFASMPSPSAGSGKKMSLYEVACVSGSGSTSNSIVFFEDQGRFVAIANQTDASNMDAAMDNRDKIAGAVQKM